MKDYSVMSDFEINKAVGELTGEATSTEPTFEMVIRNANGRRFDPCNNPADAWSIIMDNNIAVIPYRHTLPCAWPTAFGMASKFTTEDKNPLRAAMVTFLMMKDREVSHA